jgi:hypothetical protein
MYNPRLNPALITAPDEQGRCCLLDGNGERCRQPSRFWVGSSGVDDYTHVCGDHVAAVARLDDIVVPFGK